ncbi:hypothetical protein C8J57DRAFT_1381725 [Mycena rebaudengoi]|nr:hypothetical protein C8J57DRAFT_1381725 [Mycena rebaudengoi]
MREALAECLLLAATTAASVELSNALVTAGEVRTAWSASALLAAKPMSWEFTTSIPSASSFWTRFMSSFSAAVPIARASRSRRAALCSVAVYRATAFWAGTN